MAAHVAAEPSDPLGLEHLAWAPPTVRGAPPAERARRYRRVCGSRRVRILGDPRSPARVHSRVGVRAHAVEHRATRTAGHLVEDPQATIQIIHGVRRTLKAAESVRFTPRERQGDTDAV